MDRLIYLSMSGAKATMQRQDTLANNLANVSTNGFRAELTAFRAVPVDGDGASTRVFSLETTPGYDASPGQIAATGRNLDVAMTGVGLARRAGARRHRGLHARRLARRQRRRHAGHARRACTVIGDGGPIKVPPQTEVEHRRRRHASPPTDARGHSTSIGKLKLVTPEVPLTRGTDGLFRAADGDLAADPTARVQDGALEGSNVSAVETMVGMIAAARQFEAQMKTLDDRREPTTRRRRSCSPSADTRSALADDDAAATNAAHRACAMYRTLLVPVDGSPAATAGLQEAIRLASAVGARLQLMNIIDDHAFDGDGDSADGSAGGDLRDVVRERGEAVLRHAQALPMQAGVGSATSLVHGGGEDLQALVARQAEQSSADLVVLGSHAGKALSRLFMSHDAGHLLNHVAVPVLLVQSAGVDAGVTVIELSGTDSMFRSEP